MAVIETLKSRQNLTGKPAQKTAAPVSGPGKVKIPQYLSDVYTWAYIDPVNVRLLDHDWIVNLVLWGNKNRLQKALFDELEPGRRILQACCVYGDLSPKLAQFIGPKGRYEVIDVSPAQVEVCRRKLQDFPQARVRFADAAEPGGGPYDTVISFFLVHEIPEDYKRTVVNALLGSLAPGGKVVFIDYHKPHPLHPLKWATSLVFDFLEPFAKSLWRHEISDFANEKEKYIWRTETYFGGLFQKTVVQRKAGK